MDNTLSHLTLEQLEERHRLNGLRGIASSQALRDEIARRKDPSEYVHIFCTPFGIPPAVTDAPICGAKLPRDWSGRGKPECPKCNLEKARILARAAQRRAAGLALAGK